jgi:hypothetical protein
VRVGECEADVRAGRRRGRLSAARTGRARRARVGARELLGAARWMMPVVFLLLLLFLPLFSRGCTDCSLYALLLDLFP